jgi:hypothetical protein
MKYTPYGEDEDEFEETDCEILAVICLLLRRENMLLELTQKLQ